jgi:hypothetical protein
MVVVLDGYEALSAWIRRHGQKLVLHIPNGFNAGRQRLSGIVADR